mmetsp:Transcript_1727/g.2333  ORF Transcript_1727/g.2333 Transcript_1727/m.2333 type:complete len:275 (-) Transcript_1727:755-1579(-)
MRSSIRKQRGIIPHHAVIRWSYVWSNQHRRKLRNCVRRPVLLAVCNRSPTFIGCSRVLAWRHLLVRHSLLVGDISWTRLYCTSTPHRGRRGRIWPRSSRRRNRTSGYCRLRSYFGYAFHGDRVYWIGRVDRGFIVGCLRHLQRIHQPRGHRKTNSLCLTNCHRRVRSSYGYPINRPKRDGPELGMGLPLHGSRNRKCCHSALEHDDLEEGIGNRCCHRSLARSCPRCGLLVDRSSSPVRRDLRRYSRCQRGHALRKLGRHLHERNHSFHLLHVH